MNQQLVGSEEGNIMQMLQHELYNKERQIEELSQIVSTLSVENQRLKQENNEMAAALAKNKKMKNMEIETLNKIIKNLQQQCKNAKKTKTDHRQQNHQPDHQDPIVENTQTSKFMKRIKTQKQLLNQKNSQETGLKDLIHEMRLELADMRQSHLKMRRENEKMHEKMKQHMAKNNSVCDKSNTSQKNNHNSSFEGLNMGECFMGRKSKIKYNEAVEKPWGRTHQLNWDKKEQFLEQLKSKNSQAVISRPQSEIPSRTDRIESWVGIQEQLNYIKEENQELRRSIFD